jgi:bifunctional non-homologous end joining protein LigD
MTTGSRGLHVVVPLKKIHDFDDVRDIARGIAQQLADTYPDELTIEMRKAKRGKRIFVDYLRNAWAQTSVAPYAVRAKPSAPIATPVSWKELFGQVSSSQAYTIKTIRKRIEQVGDLWHDIDAHACSLKRVAQKIR